MKDIDKEMSDVIVTLINEGYNDSEIIEAITKEFEITYPSDLAGIVAAFRDEVYSKIKPKETAVSKKAQSIWAGMTKKQRLKVLRDTGTSWKYAKVDNLYDIDSSSAIDVIEDWLLRETATKETAEFEVIELTGKSKKVFYVIERNGEYVRDKDGKPYTFKTKGEANDYIKYLESGTKETATKETAQSQIDDMIFDIRQRIQNGFDDNIILDEMVRKYGIENQQHILDLIKDIRTNETVVEVINVPKNEDIQEVVDDIDNNVTELKQNLKKMGMYEVSRMREKAEVSVTEEEFKRYEELRRSGKVNMFNLGWVMLETDLTKKQIFFIMDHFYELYKKYYLSENSTPSQTQRLEKASKMIDKYTAAGALAKAWEKASKQTAEKISGIPDEVFEEFEIIRQAGECNMWDMNCVLRYAYENDLYEIVSFVMDDKKKYSQILENYRKYFETASKEKAQGYYLEFVDKETRDDALKELEKNGFTGGRPSMETYIIFDNETEKNNAKKILTWLGMKGLETQIKKSIKKTMVESSTDLDDVIDGKVVSLLRKGKSDDEIIKEVYDYIVSNTDFLTEYNLSEEELKDKIIDSINLYSRTVAEDANYQQTLSSQHSGRIFEMSKRNLKTYEDLKNYLQDYLQRMHDQYGYYGLTEQEIKDFSLKTDWSIDDVKKALKELGYQSIKSRKARHLTTADKRPPKAGFDKCVKDASVWADNPEAACSAIYYHPESFKKNASNVGKELKKKYWGETATKRLNTATTEKEEVEEAWEAVQGEYAEEKKKYFDEDKDFDFRESVAEMFSNEMEKRGYTLVKNLPTTDESDIILRFEKDGKQIDVKIGWNYMIGDYEVEVI